MRTFATMAHFDPRGKVAPHVRAHIDALRSVVDRLIVVSTADLLPADEAWLRERAELLRRDNFGYDFFSYRSGLLAVDDLAEYDRVIVCNDTFVGPLGGYQRILDDMQARPVDFWGLTWSDEITPHVQSYFLCFRPWVVRSEAFTQFWKRMTPLSDRFQVIRSYEVGLSHVLERAGFRGAAYFTETREDRVAARARMWWRAALVSHTQRGGKRRETVTRLAAEPWNPCIELADRALPEGRLPMVKIDTLRYDPSSLQAQRLLARCETVYPEYFGDVAGYLRDTEPFYFARRPRARLTIPPTLTGLQPLVRYA